MAEKILVPLKRDDNIEDIIPYVEKVAQPGMKFVFLVHCPVDGFEYTFDHVVTTMETRLPKTAAAMKVAKSYSLEERRRLAKQKILSPTGALRKRGMEIAVDVHAGSLRTGIGGYIRNGDVHLIMMLASRGFPIMRLLRRTIELFGLFKRPSFSPVLLLHPIQGVAHS